MRNHIRRFSLTKISHTMSLENRCVSGFECFILVTNRPVILYFRFFKFLKMLQALFQGRIFIRFQNSCTDPSSQNSKYQYFAPPPDDGEF